MSKAGRPLKDTIDWFPHQIHDGKTMFILQTEFGNDGYAFWFKLLERLGKMKGLFLDCNKPDEWRFLVAKTAVEDNTAIEILNTLAEIEAIDKKLWTQKIIWVQNFVDGITSIFKKRGCAPPQKPNFWNRNPSNPEFLEQKPEESRISDPLQTVETVQTIHREKSSCSTSSETDVNEEKIEEEPRQQKYPEQSDPVCLTTLLVNLMRGNNPNVKIPDKLEIWQTAIDRMIRIDKRTPEEIETVLRWSQADDFWSTNILSTTKLRKQYDQLWLKMQQTGNPARASPGKTMIQHGDVLDKEKEFIR